MPPEETRWIKNMKTQADEAVSIDTTDQVLSATFKKPRTFRFKVPIWLLMALIVFLALPISWVTNRVRTQRRAVGAITRAGGSAWYDFQQVPSGQWDPTVKNQTPRWLLSCVPEECFQDVTLINLRKELAAGTGDKELSQIAGLSQVEYLDLAGSQVTDDGLAHLRGYKRLKYLYLSNTNITDAGLAHLAGLSELRNLLIDGTHVSDAGLAHLKSLHKLNALGLQGTRMTNSGVNDIKRSNSLLKKYFDTP
jgi:Leucine rich repeat